MTDALEHHFTSTTPRLHYVSAGPPDGPPVILLHGFPDFWYGWRHQLPALANAGLRVYALDQRGYNTSDKPAGARHYSLDALAEDVLRLADEVAPGRQIDLIGHDFGAAVAWWLTAFRPERIRRQVIVNVPHPAVFLRTVVRDPRQLLRSWYIVAVQLPRLPEALLGARNFRGLTNAVLKSSRPGAFPPADLTLYRQAWSQPGALTAMLNWYRAGVGKPHGGDADGLGVRRTHDTGVRSATSFPSTRITTPTLILWGKHDVALIPQLAPASRALCDHADLIVFEHCSHWPHLEEPIAVNDHIVRFLLSEA